MKFKNQIFLFFALFTIISNTSQGQVDLEDSKVLKLGYRLGITRFNPAFVAVQSNTTIAPKEFSDYIIPSNLDIFFGKNSEHAFYDANLGGLVYLLADYTYNLATGHEPNWVNEKLRKSQKNFPGLKEPARGYDFDIMDMKLAFGGKGIFFGGQLGYTSFGPSTGLPTYDKDSVRVYDPTSPYLSYGLGLHYNKDMGAYVMQNSVMFDVLKNKKNHFDGFGIKVESVIYLGKDNGFYVAPYLKWRSFSSIVTTTSYGYSPITGTNTTTNADVKVKGSALSFGLRAGFYLSE